MIIKNKKPNKKRKKTSKNNKNNSNKKTEKNAYISRMYTYIDLNGLSSGKVLTLKHGGGLCSHAAGTQLIPSPLYPSGQGPHR